MRQQLVMGNWKMNGSRESVRELLSSLLDAFPSDTSATVVVFPPAIFIPEVAEMLKDTPILWGAQNVSSEESGAYTGELSAAMLKAYGCSYVLVGHSERRTIFHEDEKSIAKKFHQVKVHDMIPVLCVGETEKERQLGQTLTVLGAQLGIVAEMVGDDAFAESVVAYEPVWAIGTGNTATPEDAANVQQSIRDMVAACSPGHEAALPIVYGGSVNEITAPALFAMSDIDGGLVGGASLKAKQFLEIVKCIKS